MWPFSKEKKTRCRGVKRLDDRHVLVRFEDGVECVVSYTPLLASELLVAYAYYTDGSAAVGRDQREACEAAQEFQRADERARDQAERAKRFQALLTK